MALYSWDGVQEDATRRRAARGTSGSNPDRDLKPEALRNFMETDDVPGLNQETFCEKCGRKKSHETCENCGEIKKIKTSSERRDYRIG